MVSISDFDSDDIGSNPVSITIYRSIPIGWIPHLDWGGCRFESCLLYKYSHRLMV